MSYVMECSCNIFNLKEKKRKKTSYNSHSSKLDF